MLFSIILTCSLFMLACQQSPASTNPTSQQQNEQQNSNNQPANNQPANNPQANNTAGQDQAGNETNYEKIEIKYIDRNGNQHIIDLSQLPITNGVGGFKKSGGGISGPVGFSGPLLDELVNVYGGFTDEDALEVTATDDYMMTLSKEQTQGDITIYNSDGAPIGTGPSDVMIAIDSDAEEMKSSFPRIVYVSQDSPITDGHFWVRNIAEIKVVPSIIEWNLTMTGLSEYISDRSTFESIANCHNSPHPPQTFEKENKQGTLDTYEGVPLWALLSTVDGNDLETGHYRFNKELADAGYTVQIVAKDGYKVELTSQEVIYNNDIIVAYRMNNKPLPEEDGPLQLVGSGLPSKQHSIKNIAKIEIVNIPQ